MNKTLSCPQIIILTSKYHYTITNNFLDVNIFKLSQRVVKSPGDLKKKKLSTSWQPDKLSEHHISKKSIQHPYKDMTERRKKKSKHLSTTKLSEHHTCKKRSQQKKLNTASKHRHAKETQHSIHTQACKGNATNYWTTTPIRRAASCSKCGTAQCGTAGNHHLQSKGNSHYVHSDGN